MSAGHKRIIVASMLAVLSTSYGLVAYFSFGMTEAFTVIVRRLVNKPPVRAVHKWDEWSFMVVCGIAALGVIAAFLRANWGRLVSVVAFGASGLWALTISLAPESWQGVWFYTWLDRWAAALVALISIGGLTWLCTRDAKDEFLGARVAP